MTIHDTHPFAASGQPRRPLRRFRGRLPAPVTIWAAVTARGPVGLTVSSMVVADGEPGEVAGLDAMAGLAPAPGGPFRLAQWRDTDWGPVLATSPGWLGVRLLGQPVEAGWSMLIRGVVEHTQIDESVAPVAYVRGRYREL